MGKTVGYKSFREEQNLAVEGILSGRDVFVTGSPRAREEGARVHGWARDKVRDFLEYFKFHENSEC